jgi:Na+/H+ antiporter NhaD/arsenite permease-like protein
LKKILTLLGTFFMVMLLLPTYVRAAESHASAVQVPVWLCIPFAGLLLCIAVMPLLRAEWWEAHQPLVVFMWIILLVVPFAIVYGAGDTFETVLECIVNDYLTFIVLLFVFYHLDKKAYRKDIAEGRKPDISRPGTEFYIEGLHNIILLAAFLSIKTTDSSIRTKNHFTWGAIKEVAVLFIGIFITMQPALMLLKSVGPNLGISEPYQMFWATGALSSFLDNTPTYLVFLTTAGTLGLTGGITTALGQIPVNLLEAISCGAVFMGANTYIGNAPNFMVKAISDENGVNMPSFFGYILWSLAFLVPVFILDMFVFFL